MQQMNGLTQPRLVVSSLMLDPTVTPFMQRLLQEHPEVFKHSLNVAYLAAEVCCTSLKNDLNFKVELTDKESIEVIKGALLHDIGKLSIPNKVLNKPEKLSESDIKSIMMHPQVGYQMLIDSGNKYSKTVLDIVKHHHEKLDGMGYPDHIKKIPPTTQLVAYCDMFDALTETRAYRSKKSIFSAYKIISDEHLDNDLFLLLASCFDR